MISLILITTISWVVVYLFEGFHDIDVIKSSAPGYDKEKSGWHFKDGMMFTVLHFYSAYLIYLIKEDLTLTIILFILSIGIRVSVHETVINLILHKDLFHTPTSKHNWFDRMFIKLKVGKIYMFLYRYGLLLLSIYFIIKYL